VLSHYDLGAIHTLRRFRGGSRTSPKIILDTDTGRYLLKRRPTGAQSQHDRVAFTHEVVAHLAGNEFPVPQLVRTRAGRTILELNTGIYELYRFIKGDRFNRSVDQALGAGWWLARCHAALADLSSAAPTPARSFHAHPRMVERIGSITSALNDPSARDLVHRLADVYTAAAEHAERLGAGAAHASTQVIHGDYHPGNMLFAPLPPPNLGPVSRLPSGARMVVGLFDFDSARKGEALHELANGAMQFSVHRQFDLSSASASAQAANWRIALDPDLFRSFFTGYAYAKGPMNLDADAVRAIPYLMIEALIVEAVIPIANTGKFGKLAGKPVLEVVLKAADAMSTSADKLIDLIIAAQPGTER
jgi:Ser/Thr protein kinase RdoA (MazF antagonist)